MINLIELLLESWSTLTLNKTRTGLAILGIVIGIGSVIALMSLGQATQQAVQTQIQSLGSNLLTVMPGGNNQGGVRGAAGSRTTLVLDDAKAISSSPKITTIAQVSPEYSSRAQVIAKGNNSNVQIIGVTQTYAQVHKINLTSGSFISQQHVQSMAKVAVIGPQAASDCLEKILIQLAKQSELTIKT